MVLVVFAHGKAHGSQPCRCGSTPTDGIFIWLSSNLHASDDNIIYGLYRFEKCYISYLSWFATPIEVEPGTMHSKRIYLITIIRIPRKEVN